MPKPRPYSKKDALFFLKLRIRAHLWCLRHTTYSTSVNKALYYPSKSEDIERKQTAIKKILKRALKKALELPVLCAPKPLDRTLFTVEALDYRYLNCPAYDRCLDFMALRGQKSFICTECPVWKIEKNLAEPFFCNWLKSEEKTK